jgi:hypothetical protein
MKVQGQVNECKSGDSAMMGARRSCPLIDNGARNIVCPQGALYFAERDGINEDIHLAQYTEYVMLLFAFWANRMRSNACSCRIRSRIGSASYSQKGVPTLGADLCTASIRVVQGSRVYSRDNFPIRFCLSVIGALVRT